MNSSTNHLMSSGVPLHARNTQITQPTPTATRILYGCRTLISCAQERGQITRIYKSRNLSCVLQFTSSYSTLGSRKGEAVAESPVFIWPTACFAVVSYVNIKRCQEPTHASLQRRLQAPGVNWRRHYYGASWDQPSLCPLEDADPSSFRGVGDMF